MTRWLVVGLLSSIEPLNSVCLFQQYDGLQKEEWTLLVANNLIPLIISGVALCLKKMTYQSVEILSAYSFTQPVDQEEGD